MADKIRVLNLYAGIGGNRKLWEDVEVTAVEINRSIAEIYKDFFPDDKVVVEDAHKYLLDHYDEFDFIWSSPPCQTHSSFRYNIGVKLRGIKPEYPDMRLYQEVIFCLHHCKGKWVVENVSPYYDELLPSQKLQRHFFWANFTILQKEFEQDQIRTVQIPQLQQITGFNLYKYRLKNKRQILRNCVNPKLGLHIFKCAFKEKQMRLDTDG